MAKGPTKMRLLISGYRNYHDVDAIREAILRKVRSSGAPHLILGDCPTGVDAIAMQFADEMKWTYTVYYADWNRYGRSAGPLRNRNMVVEGKPDCALLFMAKESKGTLNMEKHLRIEKIPHEVIQVE